MLDRFDPVLNPGRRSFYAKSFDRSRRGLAGFGEEQTGELPWADARYFRQPRYG